MFDAFAVFLAQHRAVNDDPITVFFLVRPSQCRRIAESGPVPLQEIFFLVRFFVLDAASVEHRRQRFGIRQTVITPDFDEGPCREPAVPNQFLRIGERNHVVGAAVKDYGVGLHGPCRAPIPPCRAEQHEPGVAALDVHRDGTASGRTDNDLRLVFVELRLGRGDGRAEVVVIEGRVEDFKAVLGEVGRFDAARDRVPAVEKQDFHAIRTVPEGQ